MSKISARELKQLRGLHQEQIESLAKVGSLEEQKLAVLSELSELRKELEELISRLEIKYGKVKIDMATGSIIKEPEPDPEAKQDVVETE